MFQKLVSRVHPLARISPHCEQRTEIYLSDSQAAKLAEQLINRMYLLGIDDAYSDPVCAVIASQLIARIDTQASPK